MAAEEETQSRLYLAALSRHWRQREVLEHAIWERGPSPAKSSGLSVARAGVESRKRGCLGRALRLRGRVERRGDAAGVRKSTVAEISVARGHYKATAGCMA